MPKRNFHGKHPSKDCKLKLCKRSFRARHPLKTVSQSNMWKRNFCEGHPSKTARWCESDTFVRDILPKLQVEDVKMKVLCETFFKNCKSKLWNWNFVRDILSDFKNCKLKWWKRNFREKHPSKTTNCSSNGFSEGVSVKWLRWCGFSPMVSGMWLQWYCVSRAVSAVFFKEAVPVSDVINGVASMEWLSWCGFSEAMWLCWCGDFSDVFAVLWFRWSGSSEVFFSGEWCQWRSAAGWFQWCGCSDVVSVERFRWWFFSGVVSVMWLQGGFGEVVSVGRLQWCIFRKYGNVHLKSIFHHHIRQQMKLWRFAAWLRPWTFMTWPSSLLLLDPDSKHFAKPI